MDFDSRQGHELFFFPSKGSMKSSGPTLMGNWRSVPELKLLEVEAIYLSPTSAEIKNATRRTSTSSYTLMV